MTTTTTKIPLPHFLNLPLPPIPDPSNNLHQSLVFKLTLSADQFDELLNLDAEVEEGEEGGLRLEFDKTGKAQLHLSPNRLLQLNPPRSGPSRTNKPEEIYRHTPIANPSSSRSSLTGLLRIPTSTSVYDLQRHPASDHPNGSSNPTRDALEPNKSNKPLNPHHPHDQVPNQIPPPIKNSRPTPDPSQREKEKLAGQRLKEKRLEEDRKKKEKQMVVLPDELSTSAPSATRQKRQAKPKAINKQPSSVTTKHQSTPLTPNTNPATSKHQSLPSVSQPPRRALPGSQSGKQLAHVHNQHLSNPLTPSVKPAIAPSQPSLEPQPLSQPLPVPAPPPITFKRSSSNKRNKPPNLNQSNIEDPKPALPSESPSAAKFSTSTGLSGLSEEGETDHVNTEILPHNSKPPSPSRLSLKHRDSPKSSPRPDLTKYEPSPHVTETTPTEPNGSSLVPASERSFSSTSLAKRTAKKSTDLATPKMTDSPQIENVQSPMNGDLSNGPTKRRRPDMFTPNPTPPPSRPKKLTRRDETERCTTKTTAELTQSIAHPSVNGSLRAEELPRKTTGITIKKVTVPVVTERIASNHDDSVTQSTNKKRPLDSEPVTGTGINPIAKRIRQEEGGPTSNSSGLPTIRKVVRPVPDGDQSLNCNSIGPIKKIKKKKKVKQPVDYTSSEVEEGEEPGEIINTSNRAKPPIKSTPKDQNLKESSTIKSNASVPMREEPAPPPRSNPPPSTLNNKILKPNQTNTEVPSRKTTDHQPEPITRVSSTTTTTTTTTLSLEEINHDNHRTNSTGNTNANSTTPMATSSSTTSSSYKNCRLLFYKLSKHYEFVCSRLKDYQDGRLKIKSLLDIEDLLFEVHGLEIELDRVRNRIIRNYS